MLPCDQGIEAQSARTKANDYCQAAHDRQILQEINHLLGLLLGRISPEIVKYQRHRNQEQEKRESAKAGLETQQNLFRLSRIWNTAPFGLA